jgi:hypothetical protein
MPISTFVAFVVFLALDPMGPFRRTPPFAFGAAFLGVVVVFALLAAGLLVFLLLAEVLTVLLFFFWATFLVVSFETETESAVALVGSTFVVLSGELEVTLI